MTPQGHEPNQGTNANKQNSSNNMYIMFVATQDSPLPLWHQFVEMNIFREWWFKIRVFTRELAKPKLVTEFHNWEINWDSVVFFSITQIGKQENVMGQLFKHLP